MANERIPSTTLPNNFKVDGEILYGDDLNQVVTVLKGGINVNKSEIDKILTGKSSSIVVYSLDALNSISASEGTKGFVHVPDEQGGGIDVYKYLSETWVFQYELSIDKIYEMGSAKKQIYFEGDDLSQLATGDLIIDVDE